MFDNLSERLERSFKILKGEGKITEINVAETLKDVRRALLDADVNYKVAKTFTDTVKQKALGQNVLTAVKPSQLMVKIVHDELATLMGGETAELNLQGHPSVILMAGLNGAGKTTLSGKLALMLKTKKRKNPLLAACDIYRPAAIEQLKVLGEQIGIPVYSEPDNKDAVQIAQNAVKAAKAKGYDVVIVDTAGRLAVDEQMMQEIAGINPDETLFVVDAMTGQDAVNTAKEFNDRLDFDGVVLTKLDGDTRGGAALSIRTVVNKPIKFVGTGEKMEAIDQFHPSRMADRILGMGDMLFMPVGAPKPTRIQGTFVRDEEISRVLDFIKKSATVQYDEAMIEAMEKHAIQDGKKGASSADADEETGSDPMLKQAVEVVIDAGQASTSLLQRRCKLGYARAARIMDEMEEKGIIGPYEGAKPRAVLISRQQWLEMQMNQPEE